MEWVHVDPTASEKEKAEALSKIVAILGPTPETKLGRVEGGPVNLHVLWWDKTEFTSVQQLQDHVDSIYGHPIVGIQVDLTQLNYSILRF
ncbi:hypothetical protein N7540_006349 [Penicillium herquei]|nr:hypothetical protein N7540_006349 [Penicillium herquei]